MGLGDILKRALTGAGVVIGLPVLVIFVWYETHPCFESWRNLYYDHTREHGHGFAACEMRRERENDEQRYPVIGTNPSTWRPPIDAAEAGRRAAIREERARHAREMAGAPALCREAMQAGLPDRRTAAPVLLGSSAHGVEAGTWRVTGRATLTDPSGIARAYDYRCDLAGHVVTALVLTDRSGQAEPLILVGRQ